VRVFADAPAKAAQTAPADGPGEAMAQALQLMQAANSEVSIASPYFVPGPVGLALMREATGRGIRLAVMTNSLGATDEPVVHLGYTRYRLDMLKLGVKLAELSPLSGLPEAGPGRSAASTGRLHAKLAVIDRRWLLVGSMNMDRRSSRLNTEMALAIDDPVLAAEAQALLRHWQGSRYQLRLAAVQGAIEWVAQSNDGPVVHGTEPHADGLWQLPLRLLSALVPEELL
jgi:putative cardiolipin synthase